MITNADLDSLRDIVLRNFKFMGNPYDFMWTDDDSEPIDDCDAFWTDPRVLDVKYGCSKVVLFYDYLGDYVIKVPFCGVCTEEGKYINFSHATEDPDDIDENWDYCEAEEALYKKACATEPTEVDESKVFAYTYDPETDRISNDRIYILTCAFYKAAERGQTGNWYYIESILSDMLNKGIKTKDAAVDYFYTRKGED